jgi:hypothetical protein
MFCIPFIPSAYRAMLYKNDITALAFRILIKLEHYDRLMEKISFINNLDGIMG